MLPRERITLALSHREPDRVPIHDTPWGHTVNRWHAEGLPEDQSPAEYFGYEMAGQGADLSFQLPDETIEETDTYRIYKDANGATRRSFKDHESTPELIDFTITSREIWEEYKPRLAWNDKRVDWDKALAENRAQREKGLFVHFGGVIGYDRTQAMVGSPRLLMAMADDRAWVRDMFDTTAELTITACEEMLARAYDLSPSVWDDGRLSAAELR